MADYNYYTIDKSGRCIEFYRKKPADDIWAKIVISHITNKRPFGQGDAMIVRGELQNAGLEWGKDFYLKKEIKEV